ncbi:MAG: hypothetical protein ACUVQS_05445 [Candidatus Bipolaricaulaceae bacterium]
MRQGEVVGIVHPEEATEELLVHMMFGEKLQEVEREERAGSPGEPVLELRGVHTRRVGTAPALEKREPQGTPGRDRGDSRCLWQRSA